MQAVTCRTGSDLVTTYYDKLVRGPDNEKVGQERHAGQRRRWGSERANKTEWVEVEAQTTLEMA